MNNRLKISTNAIDVAGLSAKSSKSLSVSSPASNKTLIAVAMAVAASMPILASAESNFLTGAGALSATARVDVQITVPRVLYLQVGTGTYPTNVLTVDLVTFTPTAAQIANSTAGIAAATNGTLAARLVGNGGAINLTATTTGALTTGTAGETISWSQIATSTNLPAFPHPALVDGAAGAASVYGSAAAKVTNLIANWTYAFNAPAVPPAAGVYGGAGAASPGAGLNNGRVLYTAAMP